MYYYLLCPLPLLLVSVLYLNLKSMGSPSHHSDSRTDNLADEKATGLQEQSVPGDSPAYYTGDPSTDVLEIESLDLMPNPPME